MFVYFSNKTIKRGGRQVGHRIQCHDLEKKLSLVFTCRNSDHTHLLRNIKMFVLFVQHKRAVSMEMPLS